MSTQTIQIPALCIPRVFHRVTDRVIYGTFERLFGKGCIAELTMLSRQDRNTSEPYYLVFIHFNAYTSQVLQPRSASVSPTLDFHDDGVVGVPRLNLRQFDQNVAGRFRIDEGDAAPAMTGAGFLVQ